MRRAALALALAACANATADDDDPAPADTGGFVPPAVADARPMNIDDGGVLPDAARPPPDAALGVPRDDCAPEACDGLDRDCDGIVDEGCGCNAIDTACYGGPPATRGVGPCQDGARRCDVVGEAWSACEGWVGPAPDLCGDGIDQDCDGVVDNGVDCDPCADLAERCADGADNDCDGVVDEQPCEEGPEPPCAPGLERACFDADVALIGVGICAAGAQTCLPDGTFGPCAGAIGPQPEDCANGVDDDCDGTVDVCEVEVAVDLRGDCLTARCPPEAPFPVGCDIRMEGNDPRGCVASRPDNPEVYFQEGDACGAGRVTGRLRCSNQQGVGLNEQNCQINKDRRFYPPDRSGCPDTN